MRNYGRVLMATMLLATSVFGEARAGTVEPGAELTPEMFRPLPEITCAKKGLAGLTKPSCKCVKCNDAVPRSAVALLARVLILERFEDSR